MTRLIHPRIVAPVVVALVTLGLAGCTGADPAPSTSPEPTTSSDATDGSESSEPSPDSSAIPATCETVLTPDAYAKLDADGLQARAATLFDPIATEISDEGGLVCSWGAPDTDNVVDVAQIEIGDDEAEWIADLGDAGYEPNDDPVPGGYRGQPDAANGISPVVVIEAGTLTYVSTPVYAGFLPPAS
ncbi:hypothetical protein [Agromyces sp. SYSU T00266]|uniref:hypothetical protein n=1 Tax=Agromyces zhanjiangensis TaxID=3158562 RepID=UPI003399DA37